MGEGSRVVVVDPGMKGQEGCTRDISISQHGWWWGEEEASHMPTGVTYFKLDFPWVKGLLSTAFHLFRFCRFCSSQKCFFPFSVSLTRLQTLYLSQNLSVSSPLRVYVVLNWRGTHENLRSPKIPHRDLSPVAVRPTLCIVHKCVLASPADVPFESWYLIGTKYHYFRLINMIQRNWTTGLNGDLQKGAPISCALLWLTWNRRCVGERSRLCPGLGPQVHGKSAPEESIFAPSLASCGAPLSCWVKNRLLAAADLDIP